MRSDNWQKSYLIASHGVSACFIVHVYSADILDS